MLSALLTNLPPSSRACSIGESAHYDNKDTDIIIPEDQPRSLAEFEVAKYNSALLEIARGKESHVVACTEAKGSSSPLRPRPRGLSSRPGTHELHVVAKSRANNEECA